MTNPFDQEKDPTKHDFFRQMTSAINDWMLDRYPLFDSKLNAKINDLNSKISELGNMQNEFKILINDVRNDVRNTKKQEVLEFKSEIEKFMSKHYPEVKSSLINSSKSLEQRLKKREKKDEQMDEKFKNLCEMLEEKMLTLCTSASVYEDVYKLKDEYKQIKLFMDSFQKKIKKAFEA